MTRYIREGRMGESKTFKTGAVIGSYPKPMLVFCLDAGGLDVIPPAGTVMPKDTIPFDISAEDIVETTPEKPLAWWLKHTPLPPVLSIDYFSQRMGKLTDLYLPTANKAGFQEFVRDLNLLLESPCPFKTVVLDPVTGLSELIHAHLAATSSQKLADPRKWTPDVGYQIAKIIGNLAKLTCHSVAIFHSTNVTAENGVITGVRPMIPSLYGRDRVAGLLTQWFYATKENGKPVIYTSDKGLVKGLGCRWPYNLPIVCGPTYKDIYERTNA